MALYVYGYTGLDLAQSVEGVVYEPVASIQYWGILKGNGTTIPDLYLPISSFSYTRRGAYTSTPDSLSMVVPGLDIAPSEFDDRKAYDIELWRRLITKAGDEVEEKIFDANFDKYDSDRGATSASRTLSGSRSRTYTSSAYWALKEVISKQGDFSDNDARKEMVIGTKYQVNIVPGDTVEFDGDELVVDLLTVSVSKNKDNIIVTEVAA